MNETTISRDAKGVLLQVTGKKMERPGTVCANPEAPEAERVYQYWFTNPRKQILLPEEEGQIERFLRNAPDVITIGMTGYSALKDEQCRQWGIKPGAYEAACAGILAHTIRMLQRKFEGARIKVTHGASDLGIDKVVIGVARQLNLDQLGFNCPGWMWYVNDDDIPVYVARDKEAYGDRFVRHTDILLSVGGRDQSLISDITAAIKYGKCLITCPVMQAISSNGGPPSRDGEGKIQDATKALMTCLRLPYTAGPTRPIQGFEDLAQFVSANATDFAQASLLSPERAYAWSSLQ